VEPRTNIGTELLFENEAVRVWSMELAPGEESPYHVHKLDYVYVYVTPSRLTFMQEPGTDPACSRLRGWLRSVHGGLGSAFVTKSATSAPVFTAKSWLS